MRVQGLMGMAVVLLSGCSTTLPLIRSSEVPAAKGEARFSTGDNGNTRVVLKVEHLAPPERMSRTARNYVVWVRPFTEQASPQNVGELKVDKDLEGRLETLTPLRAFDIFVTAEDSATVQAPTGAQLLSATKK